LDTTFVKEHTLNKNHTSPSDQLGLFPLLDLLQDISNDHAKQLGFGYESSIKKGFFWVLARQKLLIDRWPSANEVLTIKTWSKPALGSFAVREYEMFVDENKIGACSTTWMILDTKTRRPKKIADSDELFQPRKDYCLDFSAGKISPPENMDAIQSFKVQASDLDQNKHVNNTIYTQWIINTLQQNFQNSFRIEEYEINFSKETFLDDEIEIFGYTNTFASSNQKELFFKANRKMDSNTVFTAKIKGCSLKL